jgi:hypothetical protein
MSSPTKVYVTIDTLALAGFDSRQRQAIVAALQAELSRHFARPETLAALGSSRSLAALRLPPFTLPAGATPRQVAALSSQRLIHGLTGVSTAGTSSR